MEAVRKEGDALYYAFNRAEERREGWFGRRKENRRAQRRASPELAEGDRANNSNGRALLSSRALVDFAASPPPTLTPPPRAATRPPPSHALDVVVWAGALRRSGDLAVRRRCSCGRYRRSSNF